MKIITDVTTLNKTIATIRTSGKKLDTLIHQAAVSALHHAAGESGNLTPLSRLALALPKSSRRKAFVFWCTQFAPVKYDAKAEKFTKTKGKNKKVFNLTGAEATPFWDYTVERKPATITIDGLISMVTKRIEAGLEKGDLKPEDVTAFETKLHTQLVA